MPQNNQKISWWQRLTIADGLFLLIGVAAAILRFAELGHIPLSPAEAAGALGVWQFWQPDTAVITVQSPAYFTLTALLTQLFGFSDAVMRAVPVLFGVGLTLLPWLLRRQLGNMGALVTSLLLAVSPLAAITARTANGDAIALFALLLFFAAWLRYEESEELRWFYAMMGAVALGLTSSALFYGGLLTLLLTHRLDGALLGPYDYTWPRRGIWQKAGAFGLVVFLALGSLFLWHLPALGSTASLLGDWVRSFGFSGGLDALINPLLTLVRYEIVLLPLGLMAMLWLLKSNGRLPNFMMLWAVLLLVLLALQWGNPSIALLLMLPGYLLLGQMADDVLQGLDDPLTWIFTIGLVLLGALMFVNIARFARLVSYSAEDLSNMWLALFVFVFTAVTVYFFWAWAQRPTYQALILAALVLFGFYQWGTAWWLGHDAANDVRERWVQAPATDDDVPVLIHTIQEISSQASGSDVGVDILNSVDSPVLHWYLRQFPQLTMANAVPLNTQTGIVITLQNIEAGFGSDYFGSDFGLLRTGLVPESLGSPLPTLDTIRWWFFHDSHAIATEERVVLWIRTDLVQP
ncbi:MAG: glycosyltransferase family 39 protein [Ardenticatenaceae bacterium]|nr:glycosyltransferase family 39 protein [Anaerolineales bacterium]MCB8922051.1 glycosyltransferase family 39 protein [Ardenticatenaceae bacterium]MCB8989627.1 glycosyltransferase family 39 protein [Ardenticatenaceae bacterium]MCB9003168.1 glycosyltransferase family 39 protein [Ardenticatenaceae bacterium]